MDQLLLDQGNIFIHPKEEQVHVLRKFLVKLPVLVFEMKKKHGKN